MINSSSPKLLALLFAVLATNLPAADLLVAMSGGGEIVSISGNAIDSVGTGLHLRPGCERLVYSTNAVRFKGQPVTDESGGKGRLVLQGNAEEQITAKTP
jgi:hypothetical protein